MDQERGISGVESGLAAGPLEDPSIELVSLTARVALVRALI